MDRFPKLVASPGMPFDALVAASEARVPAPVFNGDAGYTGPDGPHVWVLRIGETDLEFPPSRLTTIEVGGNRAVRIRSNPLLDYLPPGAAAALTAGLRDRLRAAGFGEADAASPERIQDRLPSEGEVRACRLRAGEWMGEVRVTRVIEAKSPAGQVLGLEEDACLVSCSLWDLRGAAALVG
jgi:hypothetical protein